MSSLRAPVSVSGPMSSCIVATMVKVPGWASPYPVEVPGAQWTVTNSSGLRARASGCTRPCCLRWTSWSSRLRRPPHFPMRTSSPHSSAPGNSSGLQNASHPDCVRTFLPIFHQPHAWPALPVLSELFSLRHPGYRTAWCAPRPLPEHSPIVALSPVASRWI
jgi:hypothetical protein